MRRARKCVWRVGRAARHRSANAARPSGRAGSTPALSANASQGKPNNAGVAQWQSHWLPPRRRGFDSRCPLHAPRIMLPSSSGPGSPPFKRTTRVQIPQAAPLKPFPLRLTAGCRTLNAAIVVRIHEGEPLPFRRRPPERSPRTSRRSSAVRAALSYGEGRLFKSTRRHQSLRSFSRKRQSRGDRKC